MEWGGGLAWESVTGLAQALRKCVCLWELGGTWGRSVSGATG